MGEKGARQSPSGAEAASALIDDLQALGDLTSKKRFGGYGIFREGVMFAMIDSDGRALLRADDDTAPAFIGAGSEKHGRMPYWEIPTDVRADHAMLIRWATTAAGVAAAAKRLG